MSSRAVVILTEPERCELAGPDLLMAAVLQIQQLNKAGVATSQTFCDHPAAAMTFIEAYAKAYPELQMRAADLPLPEQLYSIIASGRIMPLSAATAPEAAKPGEASQLYPLYVLSLGAPDALIRALKHNNFANSDIKVIEIAPLERPSADAVSVADAVAHEGEPAWWVGPSAGLVLDDDDGFGSTEWPSGDPLKLDSVEVDLDHIQSDHSNGQGYHYDRALDEPVPAPPSPSVETTPPSATTGEAGAGPSVAIGGASPDGGAPVGPLSPDAPEGGIPQSQPAGGISSAVGEASVLPQISVRAPPADAGSDADVAAEVQSPPSGEADAPDDPAVAETGAGVDGGNGHDRASDPAGDWGEGHAGSDPEAPPAPSSQTESSGSSTTTLTGVSLQAPGSDVLYPANASFAMDDDVSYPLPAGSGPGVLGDVFGGPADGEIDLEALFSSLSDPSGASTGARDDLELRLLGTRGAPPPDANGAETSYPGPDDPVAPGADRPATDPDDAGQEPMPVSHDLDI